MNRLWTIQEVSEFLQIPVWTLYAWRKRAYGPLGRRVGRHLRYRPEDVYTWLDQITEPAR